MSLLGSCLDALIQNQKVLKIFNLGTIRGQKTADINLGFYKRNATKVICQNKLLGKFNILIALCQGDLPLKLTPAKEFLYQWPGLST
jgi:hypothetical protein